MAEKVKVTLYGDEIEVERGTTLLELAKQYQCKEDNDIILAVVNGKLRELPRLINKSCDIQFLTTADKAGKKTYVRGLVLVLIKSLYEVVGEGNIDNFLLEFALGTGYYCEMEGKVKLNQDIIDKVKARMKELVALNLPFEKRSVPTDMAREMFKKHKMYDKANLFKYRRGSMTNVYSLDGFDDYFYGYMPASTGILKYFDLHLFEEGLILQTPSSRTPKEIGEYKPTMKLFRTLKE